MNKLTERLEKSLIVMNTCWSGDNVELGRRSLKTELINLRKLLVGELTRPSLVMNVTFTSPSSCLKESTTWAIIVWWSLVLISFTSIALLIRIIIPVSLSSHLIIAVRQPKSKFQLPGAFKAARLAGRGDQSMILGMR